jgi:hypothetical protein
MVAYTSITKFKEDLIKELGSIDEEIIFDVVHSAEDHLNILVEDFLERDDGIGKKKATMMAMDVFGTPKEIAKVYKIIDIFG